MFESKKASNDPAGHASRERPKSRAGSRPLSGVNRRIANNAAEIEVSNSPRNTRPSSRDRQNWQLLAAIGQVDKRLQRGSDAEDPPAAGKGAQLQLHVLIHLAEEDVRTPPPKRPPNALQATPVQQPLRQDSFLEVILKRREQPPCQPQPPCQSANTWRPAIVPTATMWTASS